MHDAIPSRILNGWLRLEEDLFHLQVLSSLPPQIPICCSIFVFKLYHKTCEQFYRHFGLYEKSPNSFLPGLPRSIINQFDFHNFLCLCLASVHLPYPFHLVSAFSFSVTPFCSASDRTISSMRFRAASSILAQYCLTYTQLYTGDFIVLNYCARPVPPVPAPSTVPEAAAPGFARPNVPSSFAFSSY